ncbi:MAG: DUF6259 domain-containing protein [Bryobacteraceae bacterium]
MQGGLHAEMTADGQRLSVVTANASAEFRGPDLSGFTNRATGEEYLKLPPASPLLQFSSAQPAGAALESSGWRLETDAATGVRTARLSMSNGDRTASMTVFEDAGSGELVVRVAGQSATPGLQGLSWTIAGLDIETNRIAVPADTGIVFDRAHRGVGTSLQYPHRWHAQMFAIEGRRGSAVVYAPDSRMLFKEFGLTARGSGTVDIRLETQAATPWNRASTVPSLEWRLKAVTGDWRAAAGIYADWLAAARPPQTGPDREWARDIRAVVGMEALDPALLDRLATLVDPAKTIIYLPDWRASRYDVNYPDYAPREGLGVFTARAHRWGFRVMLHANFYGVSPRNPDYVAVSEFQIRDPRTLGRVGWQWDSPASTPTRFAHISPASAAFRQLLIARLRTAVEALQADAIHLDQGALVQWNDGNGTIEGLTQLEGAVRLNRELLEAFPGLVLSTEGMNDIFQQFHSFGQSWWGEPEDPLPGNPAGHPIAQFLFGSRIRYYSHLAQPVPRDPGFKDFLGLAEKRGFLPSLLINSPEDIDTSNPDIARLLRVVRAWQKYGFQPAWTADWSGALIRFVGSGGATAALTDTGTQVRLEADGATLYQRLHDVNQIATAEYIPNWPAFDASRLYGLDPGVQYWLEQTPRPDTTRIASLPAAVKLGAETMVTPRFAVVDVRGVGVGTPSSVSVPLTTGAGRTVTGFSGNGTLVPTEAQSSLVTGVPVPGRFVVFTDVGTPVEAGATLAELPFVIRSGSTGEPARYGAPYTSGSLNPATAGGSTRATAIFAHPPSEGRTVLSWSVRLPDSRLQLSWGYGIGDGASSDTGVAFSVNINGRRYWRRSTSANAWTDASLDLSEWRGQTVLIQLVTDSLGSSFFDWAFWTDLRLAPSTPAACQYSIPAGISVGTGGGDFSLAVTSTSGACPWSPGADVPWISFASSEGGTGSAAIAYTVAPNSGSERRGTISVAGRTFIVTQAGRGQATVASVADAWSYQPGVAPGAWVTITGSAFTPAGPQVWTPSAAGEALPQALSGTRVLFNGQPAPVAYVSANQINALAPATTAAGPVAIAVENNGVPGPLFTALATATLPAFYALPDAGGSYHITALLPGSSTLIGNNAVDPRVTRIARPGETLDLFMIGLGRTADSSRFITNRSFLGAFPIAAPIAVTIGGSQAPVSFASLVSPGLYQVRVTVPAGIGPGQRTIQAVVDGAPTREGTFLSVGTP